MRRILIPVLCAFLPVALAGHAAAQSSNQAFPPINQASCTAGDFLTWAGTGSNVECKGLTQLCATYMQTYAGTAQTFKFYPEFTTQMVNGVPTQAFAGWNCVPREESP